MMRHSRRSVQDSPLLIWLIVHDHGPPVPDSEIHRLGSFDTPVSTRTHHVETRSEIAGTRHSQCEARRHVERFNARLVELGSVHKNPGRHAGIAHQASDGS